MAAFVIPSIFTAVDKVSAPVRRMSRNVQKFSVRAERGLARAERGFRRLLSPLAKARSMLGGFGLFLGGAAIVAAMGGVIGVFMDFEQANANLSSVMANATRPQLMALKADAQRLGATTAKTASEVVGLQEAFARLGFEAPQIINMTEATIAGSIALRGELSDTANLVGALVKTFDDFSSIDTPQIIDQLTVATQSSALNFEKLQTGLPIVAGAANAAGISFTRLLALMGKLSDAGIDVSSSSTAIRNIFIESAKQGLSFSKIIEKIEKSQDKLTAANDEFGKRAAVPAAILSKNIRATDELDAKLRSAAKGQALSGAASIAAAKQLDTLGGSLTILNSAWEGFILSMEDGTGAFSSTLKLTARVVTEILSLASGTAKASGNLSIMEKRIRVLAERSIFWLKVIRNTVIGLIAFKAILIASRFILSGYSIALGIAAVAQGRMAFSLRANTLALSTYAFAAKAVTAVQWLWNAALAANPIGIVIIAIASLIGLIALVIIKWDEWRESIIEFAGPFGIAVLAIETLIKNLGLLKSAFIEGGFSKLFTTLNLVSLEAIEKTPQFAKDITPEVFEAVRNKIELDLATRGGTLEPVNVQSVAAEAQRTDRFESSETSEVNIRIADETGRADISTEGPLKTVKVTPTFGPGSGAKF